MTDSIITFIYILAACGGVDEANGAHAGASLADLARATVFLLVTARLASAVNTDFSLETILV